MAESDFLIIGGGIIGVCLAREIQIRFPDSKIVLIEKEKSWAQHASGRNSGVLHAGFYYSADSLKAKFTKLGNEYWRDYCAKNKIPVLKCGKLVVAQNDSDLSQIDELLARARINDVDLQEISLADAKKIEPRAKSHKRILWSPTTATVDPIEVLNSVVKDATRDGIDFHLDTRYLKKTDTGIETNRGVFKTKYVINAAGLYADRIAKDFGFAEKYRILPFKGLYLYAGENFGQLNTHIYPVPNLKNPFLGVHFTLTMDGHVKLGPTAIPAFWLEQYQGFDNFKLSEFCQVVGLEIRLLFGSEFDFKKLAFEELRKYSKTHLVSLAQNLIEGMDAKSFEQWGRPGIRAQLLNIHTNKLEMDFIFEGNKNSFHVLNAVSPAFTSAVPFCEFLTKQICDLI